MYSRAIGKVNNNNMYLGLEKKLPLFNCNILYLTKQYYVKLSKIDQ